MLSDLFVLMVKKKTLLVESVIKLYFAYKPPFHFSLTSDHAQMTRPTTARSQSLRKSLRRL